MPDATRDAGDGADGTAALCANGITATGLHCTGSAHVGSRLIRCTDPSHNAATVTFAGLLNDPTQQLDTESVVLQAVLAEQERDRLRAEGWRACVDHISHTWKGWLYGEDLYWVGRRNPFSARVIPPGSSDPSEGS